MERKHIFETADCANYELLKANARNNRNNPTEAERLLWYHLKGGINGCKFRRQHIIDNFIADFVCLSKKIVIEVDGGYHDSAEQIIKDAARTDILKGYGFKVIRFNNDDILYDIEKVILIIKSELY